MHVPAAISVGAGAMRCSQRRDGRPAGRRHVAREFGQWARFSWRCAAARTRSRRADFARCSDRLRPSPAASPDAIRRPRPNMRHARGPTPAGGPRRYCARPRRDPRTRGTSCPAAGVCAATGRPPVMRVKRLDHVVEATRSPSARISMPESVALRPRFRWQDGFHWQDGAPCPTRRAPWRRASRRRRGPRAIAACQLVEACFASAAVAPRNGRKQFGIAFELRRSDAAARRNRQVAPPSRLDRPSTLSSQPAETTAVQRRTARTAPPTMSRSIPAPETPPADRPPTTAPLTIDHATYPSGRAIITCATRWPRVAIRLIAIRN